MSAIDWDSLPRMLWEQCEGGCGQMGQTLYGRPRENGPGHVWACRSCYLRDEFPTVRVDLSALAKARAVAS